MKKYTYITIILTVATLLLQHSGILDALILFLLVGNLPGVNFTIPAGTMLLLMILSLWLVVAQCIILPTLRILRIEKRAKQYLLRKNQFPKRRYQRI